MTVDFHVFNVNHGDSILVEINNNESKYILVDCNLIRKNATFFNPACEYLKSKKAKKLNALVITHFHFDHIFGLDEILKNFEIEKLFIPPVFCKDAVIFKKLLDRYRRKIMEVSSKTSDYLINRQMLSMAELLKFMKNNPGKVEEVSGKEMVFRAPGVQDDELTGNIYLPMKKLKSKIREAIEKGNFDFDNYTVMNEMSVSIVFKCFGKRILLTGDSTKNQWEEHRMAMNRDGINNLDVVFLKVPHHGSRENNDRKLYEYLFDLSSAENKYLFISANGRTHPHEEIFKLITDLKLKPYCTNLAKNCSLALADTPDDLNRFPKEMVSFINNYDFDVMDKPVTCQGDICLSLDDTGYDIKNSTSMPCIYR